MPTNSRPPKHIFIVDISSYLRDVPNIILKRGKKVVMSVRYTYKSLFGVLREN